MLLSIYIYGVRRSFMSDIYKKLIAKNGTNYQSLLVHSINTGLTAINIVSSEKYENIINVFEKEYNIDKSEIIQLAGWSAAVHDIGKASPFWQEEMDEEIKNLLVAEGITQEYVSDEPFRHEKYSAKIVEEYLIEKGYHQRFAKSIATAVRYHHEGKKGKWAEPSFGKQYDWENIQKQIFEDISKVFPLPYIQYNKFQTKADAFFHFIESIINISDWIASGEIFESDKFCKDVLVYSSIADEKSKKCLSKIGILKDNTLPKTLTITDLDEKIKNPRPLQVIAKNLPQFIKNIRFVIIEAPTGEGKTEAAELLGAQAGEGKRGIAFALPTAATTDSIFKRISPVFKKFDADIVKTHSLSKLDDNSFLSSAEDADWLKPSRLNLLMKNIVCTVDQVMMAVLPFRYSKLRLLGLIDKVLIIDEIHAYDAYMNTIIENLLMWAREYEIPVILLSATLPYKKKKSLIEAYAGKEYDIPKEDNYPLITVLDKDKNLYFKNFKASDEREIEVEMKPILNDYEAIWELISPVVSKGGNIAIVFNTVKEAQACFKAIKKKFENTMLLTALTKVKYKKEKFEICEKLYGPKRETTNDAKGSIVVATQVIEQSLNVDFDWVLTALCPIDLLIQRIGREHRFNFISRPDWLSKRKMTVLTMPEDTFNLSEIIYYPYILNRTEEVLKTKEKIKIPDDTRTLIEYVYADVRPEDITEWNKSQINDYQAYKNADKLKEISARAVMLPEPKPNKYSKVNASIMFAPDEDLEDESLVAVSTRIGEPSQRIILVEESEFLKYNFDSLSKDDCNELFNESLTISLKKVFTEPAEGFLPPIKIESGVLKNSIVYATKSNEFHFKNGRIYKISFENDFEIL